MTIVCGTDFSESATSAARVAALLARQANLPMKLVHVIDELGVEYAVATHKDQIYEPVRERVAAEARRSSLSRRQVSLTKLWPKSLARSGPPYSSSRRWESESGNAVYLEVSQSGSLRRPRCPSW